MQGTLFLFFSASMSICLSPHSLSMVTSTSNECPHLFCQRQTLQSSLHSDCWLGKVLCPASRVNWTYKAERELWEGIEGVGEAEFRHFTIDVYMQGTAILSMDQITYLHKKEGEKRLCWWWVINDTRIPDELDKKAVLVMIVNQYSIPLKWISFELRHGRKTAS